MKKRLILLFLTVLTLLCAISCQEETTQTCCAYFRDSEVLFVFSPESDKLYEIELPLNTMVLWASEKGFDSAKQMTDSFCGFKTGVFIVSDPITRMALTDIFSELDGDYTLLCQQPLLSRINAILNTDISGICQAIVEYRPVLVKIDATSFLDSDDLEYSRDFFETWLKQLIY